MHQTQAIVDFQVIVVVDGSTDGTREMLSGLSVPYDLTVLWQENRGQNVARNRGVKAACGRYLLFLDDDIVPEPGLVAEHLRVQKSGEKVVGIGQMTMKLPPSADWFARRFVEGWRRHYEELNRKERLPTWMDCYGGNVSMERRFFLELKGFAEDVRRSHDIELGYRLMQNGAVFVYVCDAVGQLNERKGIRELARDYRAAGGAYVQLVQRHPPMLPILIGGLSKANFREWLLREVLYFLRLPHRLLGWIGVALRNPLWERKWFRFLHNYFYWSGVRRAIRDREMWRMLMHGTPILMYHAFTEKKTGSRFIMPVRRFARQMWWLRRLGYRVIGLEELLRIRREHLLPPTRSVVITIDDGYAETLTLASPVLRSYGYPATLFVVSDRVGAANSWSNGDGLKARPLLSWDEIARMAGDGVELGAHTRTHAKLTDLPRGRAREEVLASKQEIESRLQIPIRSFAYPYGESNAAAEEIVRETGFWGACGVEPGLNTPGTPAYALHRVEIEGTLPWFRFLLAIWLGETCLRIR
jgi:peptidoglycan/xylan/chitin deacetylase (PgdA/CDA1 family)